MADLVFAVCNGAEDVGEEGEHNGEPVGEEEVLGVVGVDVYGVFAGDSCVYCWSEEI